ncbi:cytochrome c [Mucilaginibacter sp. UR6-11]|uniref:c-type cytochrome n=1 Tax=Mucilaginibacter sp. UR6-11 TaxID=1435644 RepID=UPI001E29FBF2|nr:cytochrome c [Mucilaginibacter sp. UR6-11]MCC8426161.1 cytochrome c [Mucilaginibacter sp. UR6-11]
MKLKIISAIGLLIAVLFFSCQTEDEITFARYYSTGSVVYQNKCQNCHGKDGQGLSALMPPLTDSVFLKANKALLPCIVKYGAKGKLMIINQHPFEGNMPPVDLAPIEIAEVLTYVTNSFGNKAGVVTAQQVEADLSKCN